MKEIQRETEEPPLNKYGGSVPGFSSLNIFFLDVPSITYSRTSSYYRKHITENEIIILLCVWQSTRSKDSNIREYDFLLSLVIFHKLYVGIHLNVTVLALRALYYQLTESSAVQPHRIFKDFFYYFAILFRSKVYNYLRLWWIDSILAKNREHSGKLKNFNQLLKCSRYRFRRI